MTGDQPLPSDVSSIPDRFRVLELIDDKDGTQVFRAKDTLLDREVFLKRPGAALRDAYGNEELRLRSLREARALAGVRHSSVEGLLDTIETGHGPLLVLEPNRGETLQTRLIREGTLTPDEVISLGIALASALREVHGRGIVHRAIDANCVLVNEEGGICLTGFQLAKPQGTQTTASIEFPKSPQEAPVGNPAPEQIGRTENDPRSDLFALGWLLFESMTGKPPYEDRNPLRWTEPLNARELVPQTPKRLARVLNACLAPSPSGRPKDAAAVLRALEAIQSEPEPVPAGAPPWATAAWTAVAATCAALIVLLVSGGTSLGGSTPITTAAAMGHRGALKEPLAKFKGALEPFYERSHALLIGIGDAYKDGFSGLANAERDVQAISSALSKHERFPWHTELLLGKNATEDAIVDALGLLSDRVGENDRVLIYFAGHGVPHKRATASGWLVPADGVSEKRSSWVHFDHLRRFFDESPAKHILIAIDCCYAGRLASTRSGGEDETQAADYGERYLTSLAHVVIASGRPNEKVSDGLRGGHSPFAKAFLEVLAEPGPITSTALQVRIADSFRRPPIVKQTPMLGRPESAPSSGEFVFFRGKD